MAALARLHQFRLNNLSEVISQVQHIDKKTKNIIIEGSSIEMAIIRAAYMQVSTYSKLHNVATNLSINVVILGQGRLDPRLH